MHHQHFYDFLKRFSLTLNSIMETFKTSEVLCIYLSHESIFPIGNLIVLAGNSVVHLWIRFRDKISKRINWFSASSLATSSYLQSERDNVFSGLNILKIKIASYISRLVQFHFYPILSFCAYLQIDTLYNDCDRPTLLSLHPSNLNSFSIHL